MTESKRPQRPVPQSPSVSARMSRQKAHDTEIEKQLRSKLHRRGLRFRIHQKPIDGRSGEADIIFRSLKVAIYIDGCFWHQCPIHGSIPASNHDWWKRKLDRNKERDREVTKALRDSGWTVIRIWEHEDLDQAADLVETTIRHLQTSKSLP